VAPNLAARWVSSCLPSWFLGIAFHSTGRSLGAQANGRVGARCSSSSSPRWGIVTGRGMSGDIATAALSGLLFLRRITVRTFLGRLLFPPSHGLFILGAIPCVRFRDPIFFRLKSPFDRLGYDQVDLCIYRYTFFVETEFFSVF
jgi:hypothetical protein